MRVLNPAVELLVASALRCTFAGNMTPTPPPPPSCPPPANGASFVLLSLDIQFRAPSAGTKKGDPPPPPSRPPPSPCLFPTRFLWILCSILFCVGIPFQQPPPACFGKGKGVPLSNGASLGFFLSHLCNSSVFCRYSLLPSSRCVFFSTRLLLARSYLLPQASFFLFCRSRHFLRPSGPYPREAQGRLQSPKRPQRQGHGGAMCE